jgi:hypothetical protein
MAEILSMGDYPENKIPKENLIKVFIEKFNSLDRFFKIQILSIALILMVIPVAIGGLIFDTRQNASRGEQCVPLPGCYKEGKCPEIIKYKIPKASWCVPNSSPPSACVPNPCTDPTKPCTMAMPVGGWCPTPTPTSTCLPRPSCLDTTPACAIPEPASGWCLTPTSIPTSTPIVVAEGCEFVPGQACDTGTQCAVLGKTAGVGACAVGKVCCKTLCPAITSVFCAPPAYAIAPVPPYDSNGCPRPQTCVVAAPTP